MKKIFDKSEYVLSIFYKGTKHPMKVERNTVDELCRWLCGVKNVKYVKNCESWVIKTKEDYKVKSGKIATQIIITTIEDE